MNAYSVHTDILKHYMTPLLTPFILHAFLFFYPTKDGSAEWWTQKRKQVTALYLCVTEKTSERDAHHQVEVSEQAAGRRR